MKILLVIANLVFVIPVFSQGLHGYIDYPKLSHTLQVQSIRAGNHDVEGTNDYFFRAIIHGINSTAEEMQKKFDEQAKITNEIGAFGHVSVKNLSFLGFDEASKDTLEVNGEMIRELTSAAMHQFKIKEDDVAILLEIHMFELDVEYFFLEKEKFIAKTEYYIVPRSKLEKINVSNLSLTIADEFGTEVNIKALYNKDKDKDKT